MTESAVNVKTETRKAERACVQCGVYFAYGSKNRMLCSNRCKKARYNSKNRDLINSKQRDYQKTAAGREAANRYKNSDKYKDYIERYRSDQEEHRIRVAAAKIFCEEKPWGFVKFCSHCGSEFATSLSYVKYCSADCAGKVKNLRRKRARLCQSFRRRENRLKHESVMSCPVRYTASKIRRGIRGSMTAIRGIKKSSTFDMLGYTPQELADHIERQFTKGMTWHNRDKWHIDHIVPISTAETVEDVIALNQLTNLRPLWAKDNLAKSDKREHLI